MAKIGRPKRKSLTGKQVKAAYLYAIELKSQKEIAEALGVSEQSVCAWKKNELWQAEVDRILKEEWKESCKELQKIMIAKARKGEYKPLEYVLNSNNYAAPERVEVEQKTITVSIDDDDDEE